LAPHQILQLGHFRFDFYFLFYYIAVFCKIWEVFDNRQHRFETHFFSNLWSLLHITAYYILITMPKVLSIKREAVNNFKISMLKKDDWIWCVQSLIILRHHY
jgi:hypothetical protein